VSITGLESSPFSDKVTSTASNTSPAGPLTISSKTDRVYTPVGGPSTSIVVSEAGKKKYEVLRDNLNEVVVWNPWTDASAIGDWKPLEGYKEMICVEAGAVKGWLNLEQGETWEGGQVIVTAS
jgi:glucose-6-phosphate 1-epimerase